MHIKHTRQERPPTKPGYYIYIERERQRERGRAMRRHAYVYIEIEIGRRLFVHVAHLAYISMYVHMQARKATESQRAGRFGRERANERETHMAPTASCE